MLRIALVGLGSIGGAVLEGIRGGAVGSATVVGITGRTHSLERWKHQVASAGCKVHTDPRGLLDERPDIVLEAASQQVVREWAVTFLRGNTHLMIMSVGALADPDLLASVSEAAREAGRRIYLPSGAIGGLDALQAARVSGLSQVTLISSKPPNGLAGAPYFNLHPTDLNELTTRKVLFDGNVLEGIRLFPSNVNVAAAVSLAGLGPERTSMQVVADPSLTRNTHELHARGAFGEMRVTMQNFPNPENPRTSLLAGLSALATLRRLAEPIQVG